MKSKEKKECKKDRQADNIEEITIKDDIVSMINSQQDKPESVSFSVWEYLIFHNAVKCAKAVIDGETAQNVDFTLPNPDDEFHSTLLDRAALHGSSEMVRLFLLYGGEKAVNCRCDCEGQAYHRMLPLNRLLHHISTYKYLRDWTPRQSIFKMLINLCVTIKSRPKSSLEVVRLLVLSTEKVEEEIFYYATQGKLIELSVLLMAAQETVLSPSFCRNLSPSSFQSQTCSSLGETLTLCDFILAKLASMSAFKVKLVCGSKRPDLAGLYEAKQALMSTLLLLQVFESVGEDLHAYFQTKLRADIRSKQSVADKQVAREVAWLLQIAGFNVKHEDIDTFYLERSLPREYLHQDFMLRNILASRYRPRELDFTRLEDNIICAQPQVQKGEKQLLDTLKESQKRSSGLENSLKLRVPYSNWRMNSNKYISASTMFLQQSVNALQNSKISPSCDDKELCQALASLRYHRCLSDWTAKESIFKLLCILCSPELRELLKNIRSIASSTKEIGAIGCWCAKEGELVELAALLMIAREKLLPVITSRGKDGSCSSEIMMIRQCVMYKIQDLIKAEIALMGRSHSSELAQMCKDGKAIMLFALQLLEVFESAGDAIDQYVQSEMHNDITMDKVAKDVEQLLKGAGVALRRSDALLEDLESF